MSDLGTHRYLIGQNNQGFQGGGLSDSVKDKVNNDPHINKAKQHVEQSGAAKLLKDFSEDTIKSPKDFLIVFLSGFAATFGFTRLANSLLEGSSLENSKLGHFLKNKVDKFSQNKLKVVENASNSIGKWYDKSPIASPVRGFVNHLKTYASKVQPVASMAKSQSRTIAGEVLEELLGHSIQLAGDDNNLKKSIEAIQKEFKNKPICSKTRNETFEKLTKALKGTTDKKFLNLQNLYNFHVKGVSKSFLGKTLEKMFIGARKILRFDLGLLFVGMAVKKTMDAPTGDKTSTFMSEILGNLIPYWALINLSTRLPYNVSGQLQGVPETLNKHLGKLGKVIGAPFNWAGKLLGIGLSRDLTHEMKLDRAEKLFTKAAKAGNQEKALKEFADLSQKIADGKAGGSNWFARLFKGETGLNPFKKKFWTWSSPTHKAMKKLIKNSVPLWKRFTTGFKSKAGWVGRFALIMMCMEAVASPLRKLSYKIFGKPQRVIEEERKAKEEEEKAKLEEQQAQQQQNTKPDLIPPEFLTVNNANNTNPMMNKYLQKQAGGNILQNNLNNNNSMVDKYLDKMKNTGSYSEISQPLMSSTIRNNSAAGSLFGRTEYEGVPEPLYDREAAEKRAKVNAALAGVDKTLEQAEKTLQNL